VWDSQVRIENCEFYDSGTLDRAAAVQLVRSSFHIEGTEFRDHYNCQGQGTLKAISSQGTLLDCAFRNNRHFQSWAGGVFITGSASDVSVINCVFEGNEGDDGGGISSWAGRLSVKGCVFVDNRAVIGSSDGFGGGLFVRPVVDAVVTNCLFDGNTTGDMYDPGAGGAVYGPATLRSCTIVDNRVLGDDGAGGCDGGASLEDCIVWNNAPDQLANVGNVSYSNVEGGWSGSGNLDADPRFWGPEHGDFHLLPDSPCIDSGNPSRQDVDGTRIDMGAFPFEATYCGPPGNYCVAKESSTGCLPSLGWTGTPTLAGADDFHLVATDVSPNRPGILIWCAAGADEVPFFGGTRCIAAPIVRSPVLRATAGGIGDCPGLFDYHFTQAEMTNRGLQAGTPVYFQLWHRDPGHPDGTGVGLTDGLEATLCAGP
jgi:hypothetical protein